MGGRPLIGIVGGVGPFAGLDLAKKVFDNTLVERDQDHLDLILINMPRLIPDRTDYLLGRGGDNPAIGILECVERLWIAGARIVGVPCNTAHSEAIFDIVEAEAPRRFPGIAIVHLVREAVAAALAGGAVARVGLLATPGTYASGVYARAFAREGVELLIPGEGGVERVRKAIFDRELGIKAKSHPVTSEAVALLAGEARALRDRGADLVLMGCTEIPLALDFRDFGFPLLDPAVAFARALIARADPARLAPRPVLVRD